MHLGVTAALLNHWALVRLIPETRHTAKARRFVTRPQFGYVMPVCLCKAKGRQGRHSLKTD
jgi:hypothetical protein